MNRSRVVLIAAVMLTLLTARLGWWQLDRAEQKASMQSALDQRSAMPALLAQQWPRSAADALQLEYRRTRASGIWLPELTVYLENRPLNGRPGFYLVTPLRLDDGTALLVQRGWTPRDATDRTRVTPPPVAPGLVEVSGRIAPRLSRLYEFEGAASGPIRQNLDIDGFAAEKRLKLKPWVLIQEDAKPSSKDGLTREWPAPSYGVHKHYGYAFQWFSLSGLTVGLYVWFQIIRPRRRNATPSPQA
jgi:surfeit locus 1 family protein